MYINNLNPLLTSKGGAADLVQLGKLSEHL